jgi:DNA-binding response OmpR family regulator
VATVLIVDDEPNIRRMVGAFSDRRTSGYRRSERSRRCCARKRGRPDVVLLDLMMPGSMDGMSALQHSRKRTPIFL